jgi:hypothetical protein
MRAPEVEPGELKPRDASAAAPSRTTSQAPALKPAGTRRIFGALAIFAVIVVALATWGRDSRSARAPEAPSKTPTAIGR